LQDVDSIAIADYNNDVAEDPEILYGGLLQPGIALTPEKKGKSRKEAITDVNERDSASIENYDALL